MKGVDGIYGGMWAVPRMAQNICSWLTDGPRHIFADVDATGDLLKLIHRVHSIVDPIVQILPLKRIAEAVTAITDFVNARNLISGLYDLVSGAAAWEKPFSANVPNLLKVASKAMFLIGDIGSLAEWLSSIQVLGEWVKKSTAQIVTWGKPFQVLAGIGDFSCITGSLFNLADTIRLMVRESMTDGYIKNGRLKVSALVDRVIDVASDISAIAASVLSNIPGVPAVMSMISLAVGSTIALGKFFKKIYWEAPLEVELADKGAVC